MFTDEEAQFCKILPNGGIKVHLRENMKIYFFHQILDPPIAKFHEYHFEVEFDINGSEF